MRSSVKLGAVFLLTFLLLLYLYLYTHSPLGAPDAAPYVRDLYGNATGGPAGALPRCQRCALVTSSGHLTGSGAGEEIDRAECVIRMNDAPTAGYERDVGTRTTLRVVGHSSVRLVARNAARLLLEEEEEEEEEEGSAPTLVFWGLPDRIPDRWIRSFCSAERSRCFRISRDTERSKFNALYRRETGLDRGVGSHTWLSTGFFTMVIATESCDHITVYGAVPPNHCEAPQGAQRTPYHYYEPQGPDECGFYRQHEAGMQGGSHRFITEKQVFGRWAKLYNITFTHPTW